MLQMLSGNVDKVTYFHALTGLRGLAALLVLISHLDSYGYQSPAGFGATGALAVAIFFSLSGFLMTYLYINSALTNKAAWNFLVNRFSRVYPAYFLTIAASYLISRVDSDFPFFMDFSSAVMHVLLLGSTGVFWSIPPEIQFYFLFVFIWFVFIRRHVIGGVAALALLVISVIYMVDIPGIFVLSKLVFFMTGVLAGVLRSKLDIDIMLVCFLQLFSIVGLSLLLWMGDVNYRGSDFWSDWQWALVSGFFVYLVSYDSKWIESILGNRILRFFGDISFSLYLLHVPILYWVSKYIGTDMLSIFTSLILISTLSYFTYRTVELPSGKYIKNLLRVR